MPRESDQCFTPEWIFKSMRIKFDLDVASPIGGVPWIPAKRSLSHIDNGLKTEWKGRVWMNPPFSDPALWAKKFTAHGNGVALLAFSKSKAFDVIWASDALIVALPARLKFVKEGKNHAIFMPCFLAAHGDVCKRAIRRVGVSRCCY